MIEIGNKAYAQKAPTNGQHPTPESQTGRIMVGTGLNSNAGLMGTVVDQEAAPVGRYQLAPYQPVTVLDTATGRVWQHNGSWNDLGKPSDQQYAVPYTPGPSTSMPNAIPPGYEPRPYAPGQLPHAAIPSSPYAPPGGSAPSYPTAAPPPWSPETADLMLELRKLAPTLDAAKIKKLRQTIEALKEEAEEEK